MSVEQEFMQQLTILHGFLRMKGKEAYMKPVQRLLIDNQKMYAEIIKLREELAHGKRVDEGNTDQST